MKRSLGMRFLPLAAIVAIQLLIIAVAPSVQEQQVASGFDPNGTPGIDGGEFIDPATGVPVGVDDGSAIGTGGDTGSGSGSGSGGSGGGGTSGSSGSAQGGGGGASGGDTSHCVGDRQYDPAIYFYAPPCTAASDGKNPGETYQGVTGEEILVVKYLGAGDPALDAIGQSQGTFVTPEQHRTYLDVVTNFINQSYELYGRKIRFEIFQGSCDTIPPDTSCLQNEFRELIQAKKPFAVMWNTSLCSACFAEMSKLRTVNLGGWNFRDDFGTRWRPYHYDVTISGTRIAQHAGRFWCNQLSGHKAEYSRSYASRTRALGVISTNDPENQATVEVDLKAELAKCGQTYGNRKYFYEQEIATADTQRRAGVLAMRGDAVDPNDDATSVMCMCDLVAPAFLYQEEDVQQYYPENIVTGTGFMDTDLASQSYIGSVGCPQGSPCAFDGAFGFQAVNDDDERLKGPGSRVWTAGGGKGPAPFATVDTEWDYWGLLAAGLQMAGPNLNPETFEQGLFRLGSRGDATHAARQISPGNYHWTQDVARVYWSSTKASKYNGEPGTYVALDPARVGIDGWRKEKLSLPAMPR